MCSLHELRKFIVKSKLSGDSEGSDSSNQRLFLSVLHSNTRYVSQVTDLLYGGYSHLNTHVRSVKAIQKGFYLLAMLTSRKSGIGNVASEFETSSSENSSAEISEASTDLNNQTLHFKLNLGANVTALVTRPDAV